MTDPTAEVLRAAGNSEKRQIIRHGLGFYRALILTGLYTQNSVDSSFDATNTDHFIPALKRCISIHPILGCTIQGEDTENPCFTRPKFMDLRNHIQVLDAAKPSGSGPKDDDLSFITETTKKVHDQPFLEVDQRPPWKIVIVPLSRDPTSSEGQSMYIIFAYSHSHGDGKSALAFHRTFLESINLQNPEYDSSYVYRPPPLQVPPPLEDACNMRISWSFLLLNLLGSMAPTVAHKLFGFEPSAANDVWSGNAMCHDPLDFRTGSESLLIGKDQVQSTLKVCREHDVKFTGVFNQLVVSALETVLPNDSASRSFLGGIVIDLRALIPTYRDGSMGNYVSVMYEPTGPSDLAALRNAKGNLKHNTAFWNAARGTTERLASCSTTLSDQPIALLKYISKFRPWLLGQLGKKRECSYEISNLVVFDPKSPASLDGLSASDSDMWEINRMIFSQPANVIGSALNVQLVTMKNGDMVITLNWQVGVLGVSDESCFARDILGEIKTALHEITG